MDTINQGGEKGGDTHEVQEQPIDRDTNQKVIESMEPKQPIPQNPTNVVSSDQGRDQAGSSMVGESINWLKYSNGVSLKCLRAMGYQAGKGLGATLQGQPMPINHENMGLNIQIDRGGAIIGGASNRYAGLGYNSRVKAPEPHSVRSQETTQPCNQEVVHSGHGLDSKPQRIQAYVRTFGQRNSADEAEEDIIDAEDNHRVIEGQTSFIASI